MDEFERSIMDYVATLDQSGRAITPETRLLEGGVLDSINLVQLVHFLEERFGIAIGDADIRPEVFESTGAIAAYVRARAG